jgi:hypothetical protein
MSVPSVREIQSISSPENERLVLGLLLNSAADFTSIGLEIDDFTLEQHRLVFAAIREVHRRGLGIDCYTVALHLRETGKLEKIEGLGWLVDLDKDTPRLPHPESYARILREKSERRKFATKAHRLAEHSLLLEATSETLAAEAAALVTLNGRVEQPPVVPAWPEPIHDDGFHGIAGELVRIIEPHTEADKAALLVQFLIGWGSLATRGPYYLAEADRHHTNEFAVIVGTTAKGRKGTSWGRILHVLNATDSHWAENCQVTGLGSGEALIDALAGEDRRALILEGEFARLLAVVSREASTISANLRNGWDTGMLSIHTRQNKVKVTGAHLSLIGHITREELLRRLDSTETANGFGNRILWVCAKRSKTLPFGGDEIKCGDLLIRLQRATEHARQMGNTSVKFDACAARLWEQAYGELSEGLPGMLGSMTSRAEAHVVRLSLIYALLDRAKEIGVEHLRAALAVWRYCEASARFIWGDAIGDPTADEILRALKAAGADGMTRWDIVDHFSRHKKAGELDRAIGVLAERGLIRSSTRDTGGRPEVRFWTL